VRRLVDRVEQAYDDEVLTEGEFEANEQLIAEVVRLSVQSTSPLERLTRALSPWVALVIVPVFALANAGVELSGEAIGGIVSDPVTCASARAGRRRRRRVGDAARAYE
jgi:hypothetical protein